MCMLNEFWLSHAFGHYIFRKRIVERKSKNSKKVERFGGDKTQKDKTQIAKLQALSTYIHARFIHRH